MIKFPAKNANVTHKECTSIVLQKVCLGLVTVWEHEVAYILNQAYCHHFITLAAKQETSYELQKKTKQNQNKNDIVMKKERKQEVEATVSHICIWVNKTSRREAACVGTFAVSMMSRSLSTHQTEEETWQDR